MPTPKLYPTLADKQRAYRERKKRRVSIQPTVTNPTVTQQETVMVQNEGVSLEEWIKKGFISPVV